MPTTSAARRRASRVRCAQAGERLTLLDGREITLDPDMLVIADASGAVGLAGIMGGAHSGDRDATHRRLPRVGAGSRPTPIAGRARRFGLFTDAAQRFERGVDPDWPARALERATRAADRDRRRQAGPAAGHDRARRTAGARADRACARARSARLLGTRCPDARSRRC